MAPSLKNATLLLGAAMLAGGLACQGPAAVPQTGTPRAADAGRETDVTQRPGWAEVPGA